MPVTIIYFYFKLLSKYVKEYKTYCKLTKLLYHTSRFSFKTEETRKTKSIYLYVYCIHR